MEKEIWKDIPKYEGIYEISNYGRIKNKKTGKLKSQRNTFKGYLQVGLSNKGDKTFRVHRLVAEAFIPNPNNLPQVNHKDGNKKNNRVDNLEWISNYDNMQHAIKLGLTKKGSSVSRGTRKDT